MWVLVCVGKSPAGKKKNGANNMAALGVRIGWFCWIRESSPGQMWEDFVSYWFYYVIL